MAATPLKTFRFLTVELVQRLLHNHLTEAALVQPDLLESAMNSPINIKHYTQEQNVFRLAANLSEKVAKNHAFQDGNKRAAMLVADTFLKINGYALQQVPFQDERTNTILSKAHLAVVNNEWTTEQLAQCYESIARPVQSVSKEIERLRAEAKEY
ncbi:DOC family protein [Elsinoe ampelina]|uniref:DOC family protein n=1 Tax=Elsinoe ampelina TaxID=302913 RepID=A0A6A6FZB9_9PEZI|nr:DOC family protein [Elsinoe ampelina]